MITFVSYTSCTRFSLKYKKWSVTQLVILIPFLNVHSTWNRYQRTVIDNTRRITQTFVFLYSYSKCNDCRIIHFTWKKQQCSLPLSIMSVIFSNLFCKVVMVSSKAPNLSFISSLSFWIDFVSITWKQRKRYKTLNSILLR